MKPTPRQPTFLDKPVEPSGEVEGPIQRSEVAAQPGVNKCAAFDMPCLPTEKRSVRFGSVVSSANPGPGRSLVGFTRTDEGISRPTPIRPDLGNKDAALSDRQHMPEILERTQDRNS